MDQCNERHICKGCDTELKKKTSKFCSSSCANRYHGSLADVQKKKSDVTRGRPKSVEHKKKISDALKKKAVDGTLPSMQIEVREKQKATKRKQADEGLLSKQGKARRALQNAPEFQEKRAIKWRATLMIRYGVSRMCDIPDVKEKANLKRSKTLSNKIANGTFVHNFGHFKHGKYESLNSGIQWYDSSWELIRMKFLDSINAKWTKKHKIAIPYVDSNQKIRNYVPDFLIENENGIFLEEIKGYKNKDYAHKVTAAEEWCKKYNMIYRVLDSKESLSK